MPGPLARVLAGRAAANSMLFRIVPPIDGTSVAVRRCGHGADHNEECVMCDYSLHAVAFRPAEASEVLVSSKFPGTHTRGFASPAEPTVAVCLRPGTEIAFEQNAVMQGALFRWKIGATLARFRQIDLDKPAQHHDALEFSNGKIVKLSDLVPGQRARVVQLPADRIIRRTPVARPVVRDMPLT
jgi:hypothetical protein